MIIKNLFKNKIAKNASWLNIIHMILSFIVGLITARYLGPGNYGLINYAAAYTAYFSSFCTLGIYSVILKDFVDHSDDEGKAIGTAIALRLISSILSIGAITILVAIIDRGEPVTLLVVFLYSLSLLFQSFDTFRQWFQSKYMSKYSAIATLVSYVIVSAYKVILLICKAGVVWFAASFAMDYFIIAVVLFIFYKKCKGPSLSFSWKKGKYLIHGGYNYILSGLMVSIYTSTDTLMLKQMLDENAVGYYSVAVLLSTVWVFVLTAIIESMKPAVIECYNKDKHEYELMNKRMYALVFYIALCASALICIAAPLLVRIGYGEAYLPSALPLRIIVWSAAFSYLGTARDAWIVCEGKQKYLKYICVSTAIFNIILNYLLIPLIGAAGAALASILTQILQVFVIPLLFKDLRPNVRLMCDAILLRGVIPRKK